MLRPSHIHRGLSDPGRTSVLGLSRGMRNRVLRAVLYDGAHPSRAGVSDRPPPDHRKGRRRGRVPIRIPAILKLSAEGGMMDPSMRSLPRTVAIATAAGLGVGIMFCGCGGHVPGTQVVSVSQLCQSALGSRVLNSAPGTVGELRSLVIGPNDRPAPNGFPGRITGQIIGWCWTGEPGNYVLYAAEGGYQPLRVEGIAVGQAPAPGPAPIT